MMFLFRVIFYKLFINVIIYFNNVIHWHDICQSCWRTTDHFVYINSLKYIALFYFIMSKHYHSSHRYIDTKQLIRFFALQNNRFHSTDPFHCVALNYFLLTILPCSVFGAHGVAIDYIVISIYFSTSVDYYTTDRNKILSKQCCGLDISGKKLTLQRRRR